MQANRIVKNLKLEDLGFDDFFATILSKLGLDGFSIARVIAEHKGAYKVKNETGEFLARVTGKQMFNASSREDFPAVGDFVAIAEQGNNQAVIHKVLPRKTVIKRQRGSEVQIIAANVDTVFVIESVDRDYNLNRLERYFALAGASGIKLAIILNKIDLISKEELAVKLGEIKKRFPNVIIIPTSNITASGSEEIKNYIKKGQTYSFLGSSGVGKSSLINKLLGENILRTDGISAYSGRGRHITTGREMYFLKNGGIVVDNPGMREVGAAEPAAGIENVFDEIIALAKLCKFKDCTHTQEPGCEVLLALEANKLDNKKYLNFLNLKKEAKFYEMSEIQKKEKNRKFGKFKKNAMKELKRFRHKDYF